MRTDKNSAQKAQTEAAYLTLLRYALWGGDFPALPADLSAILNLAERQSTRGLIFDALLRGRTDLPRETTARMQQILFQAYATNQQLDLTIQRAFPALHQAGIPAVLLKGQGVGRNYPDPRLRECGDVDVYIGPDHVEDAVRALTPLAEQVDDRPLGKHWQLHIGGIEIELHYTSVSSGTSRRKRFFHKLEEEGCSRGLAQLDFGDVRVDTPEPTFNAFYLFYHIWNHFSVGGIGLRQLCDWALHLHARQAAIDRERLREMVEGMRLLHVWQLFGCIAVHDLGLPEAEFPLYDEAAFARSRRLLAVILAEGNFGRGRKVRHKRPTGYLAGKLHSFGQSLARFHLILRIDPREAWSNILTKLTTGLRNLLHRH